MGITADALPGFLWVETTLVVLALALGLVSAWLLAALPLALLWLVLLIHLGYDGWRVFRDGMSHLTRRGGVHAGFRTVETLGILAAPVVLQSVASEISEGPDAHGVAAIGGLFIVMSVLAANAVVVVFHAAWLLGVGDAEQAAPNSTS